MCVCVYTYTCVYMYKDAIEKVLDACLATDADMLQYPIVSMCVCVYIYVCMYVCVYIYIYIYYI
jgi:hypothetical protein